MIMHLLGDRAGTRTQEERTGLSGQWTYWPRLVEFSTVLAITHLVLL